MLENIFKFLIILLIILAIIGIIVLLAISDSQVTHEPQLHVMPPNLGLPSVMYY